MEPAQGRFRTLAEPRDRARAPLREAGHERAPFMLDARRSPREDRAAQVIQAMAGFGLRTRGTDAAAMTGAADRGDCDAYAGRWPGRADPDDDVLIRPARDGFLDRGRCRNPARDRVQAARRICPDSRPYLVPRHLRGPRASRDAASGLPGHPGGLVRPPDTRLRQVDRSRAPREPARHPHGTEPVTR